MTLANKLTILRIALLPLFALAVCLSSRGVAFVGAALVVFVAIGATDYLDGFFARRRNEQTRLGTILDPLADKLTMATATVLLGTALWPAFTRLMPWTVAAVIGRDVLIVAAWAALRAAKKIQKPPAPTMTGKLSTTFQLFLIPFVLFFQLLNDAIPHDEGGLEGLRYALLAMQWWVIAWAAISLADYARRGAAMLKSPKG